MKVFKADFCVVFCENPPLFSLRRGRGWGTPEGEDSACGCVALQVSGNKKPGSWGRGRWKAALGTFLGLGQNDLPSDHIAFLWKRGKKFLGHWPEEWARFLQICSTIPHFFLITLFNEACCDRDTSKKKSSKKGLVGTAANGCTLN